MSVNDKMIFADLFFIYVFLPAVIIFYLIARCGDAILNRQRRKNRRLGLMFNENPVMNIALMVVLTVFYLWGKPAVSFVMLALILLYSFGAEVNENPFANSVLIIFSLIFYAWGEPFYIALMLFSVMINYIAGLLIDRGTKKSKPALIVGVILNIAIICVFKYSGFIVENLNALGMNIDIPDIKLPIGISFYTFQSLSYLADVYNGRVSGQRSLSGLLLYISMFPQLIAGPIVRYTTISEEINTRSSSLTDVSEGSFRFLVGLGKKVILANQLSEVSSLFLDGDLGSLTMTGAWIGIIAFTFQIYFDFSGYSDMAIGLGRCFGFEFDENFNYPYISSTITDFWRRWHISMGSFFRDYVYIPLGGNRRHQPLNILAVWFLTGLWHGASWNFVLWGLYFGVILIIEKYTIVNVQEKIPKLLLHIYSLFIIVFGWIIFYFTDFGRLGGFIKVLFGAGTAPKWDIITKGELTGNLYLFIAAAICSLPLGQLIEEHYNKTMQKGGAIPMTICKCICAFALLSASTLLLIGDTNNPFLYFRF